jgi:hypothetical protein
VLVAQFARRSFVVLGYLKHLPSFHRLTYGNGLFAMPVESDNSSFRAFSQVDKGIVTIEPQTLQYDQQLASF